MFLVKELGFFCIKNREGIIAIKETATVVLVRLRIREVGVVDVMRSLLREFGVVEDECEVDVVVRKE